MSRKPKPWFRTGTGFWMVTIGGQQHKLVEGRGNESVAWDEFYKLMATVVVAPESSDATVASLCDSFLDWCEHNTAPRTYRGNLFWLQSFVEACGLIKVSELKPYHVTRWLKSHPTWKSSNSRYNAVRLAKRAFSWAVKEGFIDRSPLEKMPLPSPEPRSEYMDEVVYRSLRRAAPRPLKCVLYALRQTGARPSEICQLTWDQVLADRWVIAKHKTARKTQRPRTIPLTRNMQRLMRILRTRRSGDRHVFLNCEGRPWNPNSILQHLKRVKDRLGIKGSVYTYQLRHSFATYAMLGGSNTAMVAELLGHVDTTMVSRTYSHLADRPELYDAVERAARAYREPKAKGA